jgi:hypothetical protein
MIKALKKLGLEGMYLNIIKTTYNKLTANILLKGEKLKTFPFKLGMRQVSTLPTFIHFSIGIPS